MRTWTMRIVGGLNVLFAALALWYLEEMIRMKWNRWPSSATGTDWVVFAVLLAISVYLVVHLAFYGIRLMKKNEAALLPCILLFAVESVGVYLSVVILWLVLPQSMNKIIFGLWWVALSPIHVEGLSGYSVLGFVVTLTLLLSRRNRLKPISAGVVTERLL
jgi:hypothetical protein